MKKIIATLSLLAAVVLPASAMAGDCIWKNSLGQVVPGPFHLTAPPMTAADLNPNVAIGQLMRPPLTIVLTTQSDNTGAPLPGGQGTATCTPALGNMRYQGIGVAVNNVYPTGIPGIGVRIHFSGATVNDYWPFTDNVDYDQRGYLGLNTGAQLQLEFIKTAASVGAGTMTGRIGEWTPTIAGIPYIVVDLSSLTLKPNGPTCALTTPDVTVDLASEDASALNAAGYLGEKDFKINLACSGGDANTLTTMHMFLTDQTSQGTRDDKLSLAAGSTATGVGIQILNNDTPVTFGPDLSGTTTKIDKAIPQGVATVDIPLKARYVRAGTATAGAVKAIATFTVTYD